jgi:ankyrin repeat protein
MRSYMHSGETLPLFLEAKADLEVKTDTGLTVLLKAVKNNINVTDIKDFLNAGARVDARDFNGKTVLHFACEQHKSANLIRILAEAGADPTARDFAGNTILHQAARQTRSYHQKEQAELLDTILELRVSPFSRNNVGQTPFHIAAGMNRSRMMTMYKTDPYEFLLGPKCNLDVNDADYRGIRPIHLAASLSEVQFARLMEEGADPLAVTVEGQSVLQIASRARQSNIVGLILDLYKDIGRTDLIDHVDKQGKTSLHYACKSGRLESVKLLLEAGADPNYKDSKNVTPLDMCLHFKNEDYHWSHRFAGEPEAYIDAAYVTLSDPRRPADEICYISTPGSDMSSENQTVGIRQIIRTLIDYGADISFMTSSDLRKSYSGRSNLFESAIESDCEVIVDELLNITEGQSITESAVEESELRYYLPWSDFEEKYVRLRAKCSPDLLESIVKEGENNIRLFHYLLKTENERGIEEVQRLGANLIKPGWNGESCLTTLAKWGYTSLLEKVGSQAAMIDEPWFREIEKTDINLPGRLRPILHIACERGLPNIAVIKVLVEKLGVNVNCQSKQDGRTALHILAQCRSWWQSHALEYLIEKGADLEARDEIGCTPLHIAVSSQKWRAVNILLEAGADPNILDSENESCLNKAGSDSKIAHLLIKHGADVSAGKKPFIFRAIESLDLATVDILISMKANCNVRPTQPKQDIPEDEDEDNFFMAQERMWAMMMDVSESSYPIHFAAQKKFNTAELKPKMIPIIESLLRGGADPMLPYNEEGDPILHEICESEGIIEPFLDARNVDLEARDSKGRTPLLAACVAPHGRHLEGKGWVYPQPSNAELLFEKGVDITVTDNEGRSVLHHLLLPKDGGIDDRINTKPIFELFISQPQGAVLATGKDKAGSTPFHYALKNRELWAIALLLEKGANPKQADPEGKTALHYICGQLSPVLDSNSVTKPLAFSLFDKFLSLDLDINARNALGETPIFHYFKHNSSYLGNLPKLLDAGADLKMKDNKGQGLLHVVAGKNFAQAQNLGRFNKDGWQNPDVEIFEWLMEKGLGLDEDAEQRTPLDIAAASGNVGILELFKRTK